MTQPAILKSLIAYN